MTYTKGISYPEASSFPETSSPPKTSSSPEAPSPPKTSSSPEAPSPPKKSSSRASAAPKHNVNWHEAASCAIEIELRDYAEMLAFQSEYILGKNSYRIDLLVIKKLIDRTIPKNIARIFSEYNLFEIKGRGSSTNISSYYKTIGYAGLFIDQTNRKGREGQCTSLNISITFLSFHYPEKLIRHLEKERNLTVAKFSPGVYYINKETFKIQIIVTRELSPEENLYLRCLTDNLQDASLINRLTDDYKKHQNQDIYTKYMHQLTTANIKAKGESLMVCEGLLNLFGTSSEEIIERTKKEEADYYLPKINELTASNHELITFNNHLSSSVKLLSDQNDYFKKLLKQNNISFDLNPDINPADGHTQ